MKTKFKINKNTFEFVNESFSTLRTWGHRTKLYQHNYLVSEAKATYINRTWEEYQYQSVMKSSVYNLIDEKLTEFIDNYKSKNGIKRLIKSLKEQLTKDFKKENKMYYTLLKKI